MASKLPKFSELPLNKDGPPLNAWGLYGKNDELGFLNRLTDDIVVDAAKEIKTGVRISLNLPLETKVTLFGRQPFEKNVYSKAPRTVNDDVWTFNTQSSSQWDGLRHYGYQKHKVFYNGVTMEDIHGANKTNVNGIGVWSEKGIVGRGILIDYKSWCEANNVTFDSFSSHPIPLADLKATLKAQGTEIKFGDILIIRSGFMNHYYTKSNEELLELTKGKPPTLAGVEQTYDMLQWIWENFAAVSADHPAFECYPASDLSLHEILLGGWGCPIGELFDLEKLAEHCRQVKRWSFFVTSEPCNVPGGVASPPNILAIF